MQFIPALSPAFPLDQLLLPHTGPGPVLVSVAGLLHSRFPPIKRLWLDSGGFAAFDPRWTLEEVGGLGRLRQGDDVLSPELVLALAEELAAEVEFTLDFPGKRDAPERLRLSEANALWRLSQPRTRPVYAAVQPGQDLTRILAAKPDGIGLGGLVPFVQQPDRLRAEVCRVRAMTKLPIHVFGLAQAQALQVIREAGATSCDSSSPQRRAISGYGPNLHWPRPSLPEQLHLALLNLHTATLAASGAS